MTTSPRRSCRPRRSSGSPLTRTSPANRTSFTWAPVGTASTSLSSCPRRMLSSPGRSVDGAHGDQSRLRPARAASPVRTVPGPEDGGPHREQPVPLAVDGLEHGGVAGDAAGLRPGGHDAAGDRPPERAAAASPRSASRPRSPSSPSPSRTTLARNRRRSQRPERAGGHQRQPDARAVVERAGRALPLLPLGRVVGTSSSPGSRRSGAAPPSSVAARSSTRRPSQSERTASSVVTVPSGSTTSTPPSARSRADAEQQLGHPAGGEPEAGVAVEQRPAAGRRRCPAAPISGLGQPLALQRLDRVAPELQRRARQAAGVQPGSRCPTTPRPARGRRGRRRRPGRWAGRSSARRPGCAGAGPRAACRRCRPAATASAPSTASSSSPAGPRSRTRAQPSSSRSRSVSGSSNARSPIRPTAPSNGARLPVGRPPSTSRAVRAGQRAARPPPMPPSSVGARRKVGVHARRRTGRRPSPALRTRSVTVEPVRGRARSRARRPAGTGSPGAARPTVPTVTRVRRSRRARCQRLPAEPGRGWRSATRATRRPAAGRAPCQVHRPSRSRLGQGSSTPPRRPRRAPCRRGSRRAPPSPPTVSPRRPPPRRSTASGRPRRSARPRGARSAARCRAWRQLTTSGPPAASLGPHLCSGR